MLYAAKTLNLTYKYEWSVQTRHRSMHAPTHLANICKWLVLCKARYFQINQERSISLHQDHWVSSRKRNWAPRDTRVRVRERERGRAVRGKNNNKKKTMRRRQKTRGEWGKKIKADRERKGSSCQTLSGVKHHHKNNLIRSESVHADTHIHTDLACVQNLCFCSKQQQAVNHICPQSLRRWMLLWCIMLKSCGGVFFCWPYTTWFLKLFLW